MTFHPFDVSVSHVAYACLGGFVVLFGMFSLFIREKLYIGEAIWAFLFGVVIGPYGGNIFNPRGWSNGSDDVSDEITLEVTRVVLAIGVFAIGVELPKQYMKKHWKSLFFLLAPVMTWGWFVSAGLIFALVPAMGFLSSLAVAACLTPTDPILAAAVVGGKYADKHVPAHIRHLLAAESGCNDGAAFPFLFISLYLIIDHTHGRALEDWFLVTWLYEVILGVVLGSILGIGFRYLMRFCERKDLIDRQSYVAQYVSLAMFTIGVTTLLGSDDLLAAFASGTAFAWDGFFNKQTEQSVFSSVIDLLFNVAAFVYIGAWMPFNEFHSEELTLSVWRLLVIAVLVLLLRRLPVIMALYRWIPDIKTFREAVFSGHFGPMGVGAVFISTLAKTRLPTPRSPPQDQVDLLAASIQPIVAFMVLCSIVTHGLSIPSFSLGRRVHSVSRTWSRHQSIDPLPEWATQTRRVACPEDVVINRDSVMERGEVDTEKTNPLTLDGSDRSISRENGHSTSKEALPRSLSSEYNSPLSSPPSTAGVEKDAVQDEARADNLPDADTEDAGVDETVEWREGPHLVIEHHAPGEEVQVKVIPNVLTDHRSPKDVSSGDVGDVVRPPLNKGVNDLSRVKSNTNSYPEHVADSNAITRREGKVAKESGTSIQYGDDDDDWRDVEDPESSRPDHRSRSPLKGAPSAASRVGKRRRDLFRRSSIAKPQRMQRSRLNSPFPSIRDSDQDQGRNSHIKMGPLPTSTSSRLHGLRSEIRQAEREASPARSVRWEDLQDHQKPISSPVIRHTPMTTRSSTPVESEGPRVQFDLPLSPAGTRG